MLDHHDHPNDDPPYDDRADDAPPSAMAISLLGRRIKAARTQHMSMKQLAEASGVSAGLISEIERGRGNPSFKTLHSLAKALGLQLGELIDVIDDAPIAGLVRKDERKRLAVGPHGPVWELLTPNLQGQLEVLETTLPDGFSNEGSPFKHVGEECVVIQVGELEINVGGTSHMLLEGDAITYDASTPHWYRNASGHAAVVLGAVTPPSF